MSAERHRRLLAEYKSLKEREVVILTELFESKLDISDKPRKDKPNLKIGDKVKLLSGGINSRIGDEGIVFKITAKRCKVRLNRNQALVKRAFNHVELL